MAERNYREKDKKEKTARKRLLKKVAKGRLLNFPSGPRL